MWNFREWLLMGVTAVGVSVLTVAVVETGALVAADDQPAVRNIPQAKWESGTCVVTAAVADKTAAAGAQGLLQAGELPALTLHVENHGSAPETLTFHLSMTVTSARDRFSRVGRPGAPGWTHDYTLLVQGGQAQDVPVDTQVKLEAGSSATLVIAPIAAADQPVRPVPNVALLRLAAAPAPTPSPSAAP